MGAIETSAVIRTLLSQLVARVNDQETALLAQQFQRYLQELEAEHRKEAADLESQLREEKTQLVAELKVLLPQAAKERDEARARARELEAKNQALETRIKVLEPKAGAPKSEPRPVNMRAPVSSQDFDVR
jgi:hypothetical protein